jgi:hypothetical protein
MAHAGDLLGPKLHETRVQFYVQNQKHVTQTSNFTSMHKFSVMTTKETKIFSLQNMAFNNPLLTFGSVP